VLAPVRARAAVALHLSSQGVLDTAPRQAYRGRMSENPVDNRRPPEGRKNDGESPPEPMSTAVDPDFVPDADQSTPEEKTARENPEETGS
jgi:hypothetical protein